jgi:hypothetical protein
MNDSLDKKVRAAGIAAWWVVLIGYALLTVTWVVYRTLVTTRPPWLVSLWGDVTWEFIQTVSLWFLGAFKFILWILALLALWLTLWARQLRKSG